MAYTTIDDPSAHFQIATWTGSSGTDTITFDGNSDLQLDFLWSKCRNTGHSHALMDTSRITSGDYLPLFADTTDVEQTFYDSELQSILSDGFTVGTQPHAGGDGKTYVGFAWKANGGSRTTFTESSNNPGGGRQANTTAGFSIVDYTGTGGAGTISHGLGAVPNWIIIKNRETSGSWIVYHHKNTSAPQTDILELQVNNATYDSNTYFNDTAPTSSVFTVNTSNDVNKDADGIIAYVFTEIQGYSKFGSYTGNGNANGAFIYTGFKPAWVMFKRTDTADLWYMKDNATNPSNPAKNTLFADLDNTTNTNSNAYVDFVSNGIKIRGNDAGINASSGDYVYMAFAEHPFVSSEGVPVTAR